MRILKFVLIFLVSLLLITTAIASFGYYKYTKIPEIKETTPILLLGKGGIGHTGPNLTDTIMLGFLNPSSKKTSLVSLPRDIWITEIRAKLNTAYHYGGFEMANTSVKSITNIDTKKLVVVDFEIFKQLIDSLGGIEVEVENSFTDNKYPIAGKENDLCGGDRTYACRYETINFEKGRELMSGERALKFVRSRNSVGDEGTDLAREKRQQKVIEAIKNKILSTDTLLDINKIKSIYEVISNNLETNISTQDLLVYAKFMVVGNFKFENLNIPEDMLIVSQNNKKYDYQYVFLPSSGSWKEFQEWLNSNI